LIIQNNATTTTTNDYANEKMLARIPPMKRILCLCPVPVPCSSLEEEQEEEMTTLRSSDKKNNKIGYEKYSIGMAVSDPYLAYAIPIIKQQTMKGYEQEEQGGEKDISFCIKRNSLVGKHKNHHLDEALEEFPVTLGELIHQSGYMDIGAIVLGRPLLLDHEVSVVVEKISRRDNNRVDPLLHLAHEHDRNNNQMDENINMVQSAFFSLLKNLIITSQKYKNMPCFKLEEERMTLQDSKTMAMEEPEMWEEIPLDDDGHSSRIIPPEIHASVALNVFLWRYTGGWRNTFA
jgi:hypothetical protein